MTMSEKTETKRRCSDCGKKYPKEATSELARFEKDADGFTRGHVVTLCMGCREPED